MNTKQLLQDKEFKSAILALIENFANANEEKTKSNNLGYDCMEKYGRFKLMLDFKIFNLQKAEKLLTVTFDSVLGGVSSISEYYNNNKVKKLSDSNGFTYHFLIQSLFEITINQLQLEFMIMKNDSYYEFMDYDFKIDKEFIDFIKNY